MRLLPAPGRSPAPTALILAEPPPGLAAADVARHAAGADAGRHPDSGRVGRRPEGVQAAHGVAARGVDHPQQTERQQQVQRHGHIAERHPVHLPAPGVRQFHPGIHGVDQRVVEEARDAEHQREQAHRHDQRHDPQRRTQAVQGQEQVGAEQHVQHHQHQTLRHRRDAAQDVQPRVETERFGADESGGADRGGGEKAAEARGRRPGRQPAGDAGAGRQRRQPGEDLAVRTADAVAARAVHDRHAHQLLLHERARMTVRQVADEPVDIR